jgi:CDP-glycerol glycerophosphotransferase (TagB/SpsB family)
LGVNPKEYNKILLWMPTWRGHSRTGINTQSESEFPIINMNNIKRLDQYTREKNVLLMIKPHPIQLNLSILNENFQNIKVIKNKDLDDANMFLYQLFHEVDALLTDYSSVYFDFLLTMKPIGFTIDDFGSYMDKRGFVVDNPLDIMPGEKITTIDELFKFINDVIEGNDKFYEERKRINDLANKYKDGDSTKRIIEFLEL